MRRASIVIVVLSIALITTNAFWLYYAIDRAITASYADASLEGEIRWREAAQLVLPLVAQGDGAEAIVKREAERKLHSVPYEKDGYLWVDELGLRFNESGRLVSVFRSYDSE
jgi:hypothetical protein